MIKQKTPPFSITPEQRRELLALFELASRGMLEITANKEILARALIISFDPLFLDADIKHSNHSAAAALHLDGKRLSVNEAFLHMEAVIVPNRFRDFNNSLIENLLTPFLEQNSIHTLIILSQGSDKAFSFARFAGKNRSSALPDNTNAVTTAKPTYPIAPRLLNAALSGPEFLECSQPNQTLFKLDSPWPVRDNRAIRTLTESKQLDSLQDLGAAISVSGSSGGHLPNETTYRALRLKEQLNSRVNIFHIQLPHLSGEEEKAPAVITQLEEIIKRLVTPADS
ncbi:hypothetical protein [Sansalvadorimonas verongulae]|uniref:hypothetical protein n=1 Tax=Sansalvadorimonas verongulae TaxID=2172824 RepID=UPI0012BB7661|nr:hypothetical protein [Sansalvadorimonas verongulae]MTI12262.1 hypothetical protein [Sansalvadorimonas verongulae]